MSVSSARGNRSRVEKGKGTDLERGEAIRAQPWCVYESPRVCSHIRNSHKTDREHTRDGGELTASLRVGWLYGVLD